MRAQLIQTAAVIAAFIEDEIYQNGKKEIPTLMAATQRILKNDNNI